MRYAVHRSSMVEHQILNLTHAGSSPAGTRKGFTCISTFSLFNLVLGKSLWGRVAVTRGSHKPLPEGLWVQLPLPQNTAVREGLLHSDEVVIGSTPIPRDYPGIAQLAEHLCHPSQFSPLE